MPLSAGQLGHVLASPASTTVLCMQALSAALLEHPEVNSSLSEDGQQLRVHHAHNVGIAMATNFGAGGPQHQACPGAERGQHCSGAEAAAAAGLHRQAAGRGPRR